MTNPLLTPWTAAFGLPPFAMIRDEDFGPAFDAGLAEARAAIAVIAGGVEAPSFANTVAAMELADSFGQTSVLTFGKLERNVSLAAESFKFTPPKGADVFGEEK